MQDDRAFPPCIPAGLRQPVVWVPPLSSLHLKMNARVVTDHIRGVSSPGKLLAPASLAAHHMRPNLGRLKLPSATFGTGLGHFCHLASRPLE
jgi:hypothetical protein